MFKLEGISSIEQFIGSIIGSKRFLFSLLICTVLFTGCNSGKIPCPKIGNKRGLALFKKKADPTIPNQEGFGQSKPVGYDKNGLMKKKSYKNLKQKPKRLKSV